MTGWHSPLEWRCPPALAFEVPRTLPAGRQLYSSSSQHPLRSFGPVRRLRVPLGPLLTDDGTPTDTDGHPESAHKRTKAVVGTLTIPPLAHPAVNRISNPVFGSSGPSRALARSLWLDHIPSWTSAPQPEPRQVESRGAAAQCRRIRTVEEQGGARSKSIQTP